MTAAMGRKRKLLVLLGLLVLGAASAGAREAPGLERLVPHYEAVRQALVADDLAGVVKPALALQREVDDLVAAPAGLGSGLAQEQRAEIEALLPVAAKAAGELVAAGTLEAARDAYYALSKSLVRWRQAVGEGPVTVYCSMYGRSWLQADDEEIGNPYGGKSMSTCGEVVGR